ncbi:hypothetical protein [Bradyrhizobium sp. CCBAU 45394]|uniref:hypothetical protein n=1 Tax=Bradyrhizobium sp. CCBAU 45394 TaxID=1325087 RepID=UPI002FE17F0A
MADHVEVKGSRFENGLLVTDLHARDEDTIRSCLTTPHKTGDHELRDPIGAIHSGS